MHTGMHTAVGEVCGYSLQSSKACEILTNFYNTYATFQR